MAKPPNPIPKDAPAPNAAALVRQIAKDKGWTATRLAKELGYSDLAHSPVPKWWNGTQGIGVPQGRQQLKQKFPTYDVDKAIGLDDALAREIVTARAAQVHGAGEEAPPASPAHAEASDRFAELLGRLDPIRAALMTELLKELLAGIARGEAAHVSADQSFALYQNQIMIACQRARSFQAQATAAVSTSIPYLPGETAGAGGAEEGRPRE